jgi:DNA-binding response OmpR family regulator
MKILLVIEDIIIGKLIKAIIQNEYTSAEVHWKENFQSSKELLQQETYDLIILHNLISGRASLEIVQLLRGEMNIFIPVVMVSDIKIEQFKRKAFQAGITSFIFQPFSVDDVITTIKQALERT